MAKRQTSSPTWDEIKRAAVQDAAVRVLADPRATDEAVMGARQALMADHTTIEGDLASLPPRAVWALRDIVRAFRAFRDAAGGHPAPALVSDAMQPTT